MRTSAQKGFTLAELLIALALLGVIAAFTIPKVLQSSGSQEAQAKVREAVATLESAYYNKQIQGTLDTSATANATPLTDLYANLIGSLNTVANAPDDVAAAANGNIPAGPFNGLSPAHPCAGFLGWVQLPNGVVIAGLRGPNLSPFPREFAQNNNVICIDYNGSSKPNRAGVDAFVGNFNQWGAFDAVVGSQAEGQKSFRWGNGSVASDPANGISPLAANGTALAAPFLEGRTHAGKHLVN